MADHGSNGPPMVKCPEGEQAAKGWLPACIGDCPKGERAGGITFLSHHRVYSGTWNKTHVYLGLSWKLTYLKKSSS